MQVDQSLCRLNIFERISLKVYLVIVIMWLVSCKKSFLNFFCKTSVFDKVQKISIFHSIEIYIFNIFKVSIINIRSLWVTFKNVCVAKFPWHLSIYLIIFYMPSWIRFYEAAEREENASYIFVTGKYQINEWFWQKLRAPNGAEARTIYRPTFVIGMRKTYIIHVFNVNIQTEY